MAERQWSQDVVEFGAGELDIRHPPEAVSAKRLSRMKNVMRTLEGELTSRPGQTSVLDGSAFGDIVHSIVRLEDPQNALYARIVGIDSGLYFGTTTLASADTGYSGTPMTFVPYRPPQSGEAWMYIGDSQRMRKIRRDGLTMPLGLPAPTAVPTVTVESAAVTDIETFADYHSFSETFGLIHGTTPGHVHDATAFSNLSTLDAHTDKAITLDLSSYSDDDIMHFWAQCLNATNIKAMTLYLICSSTFSTGYVPGADNTHNTDAFAFEWTPDKMMPPHGVPTVAWTEFGTADFPCHRSDWVRIGSTPGRGWNNITGIMFRMQIVIVDPSPTIVTLNDLWISGGGHLDNSIVGDIQYDYEYTHYDTRTGVESNPSGSSASFDALRQDTTVHVTAYGDANLRQRIYRRGGSLVDNRYFCGTNASDGGDFSDIYNDLSITLAGTVALDHDQPVTTVDAAGTTVHNVPLRSIAGPLGGTYVFGCGDPYRKGQLYYSRPFEPDHWPAGNNIEVCSPTEELMATLLYNGRGYAFSRERLFEIILNLAASDVTLTAIPGPCGHGLAGPFAWAVGPEIYFVSRDGVYATSGGVERNLSEDVLAPLFHRDLEQRSTTGELGIHLPPPIDWSSEDQLRLVVHENEVRFTYRDLAGYTHELVYSLMFHEWRWNMFDRPVRCPYSEQYAVGSTLLMGSENGVIYSHTGMNDAGAAIGCEVRTNARMQDTTRNEKLYGDVTVDVDPAGETITVRSYLNPAETLNTQSTTTGTGRSQSRHDHFSGGTLARSCSLELLWSSSTARPKIYNATLSYLVEPERVGSRATDWTDVGTPGSKLIKGCVIECNTFGVAKTITVEADGAAATVITATATGRQQLEFSWEAFSAYLVRLHPSGTGDLAMYAVKWITSELPLTLSRWETRPMDHGFRNYHSHYDAFVTLSSTAAVTLTFTYDGDVDDAYVIPSTLGMTKKIYIPLRANKELLTSYTLTSTVPFTLYQGETSVRIFVWDQPAALLVHPFGGDDDDPSTRSEDRGWPPQMQT